MQERTVKHLVTTLIFQELICDTASRAFLGRLFSVCRMPTVGTES